MIGMQCQVSYIYVSAGRLAGGQAGRRKQGRLAQLVAYYLSI
jgi:hypothetical protein